LFPLFGAYNPDRHHQKGSCITHILKSLQLALLVLHALPSAQAHDAKAKNYDAKLLPLPAAS
jgi:hypothetical protein